MKMNLKIWFDKEGDFLEVLFSDAPGYMRETDNDFVMERVDEEGHLLGFAIQGISNIDNNHTIKTELVFV